MTQHYRVHGRRIAAQVAGHGEPILLVHGFPLSHRMWHGQISHLGQSFRLIAPDLRGFGLSDPHVGDTLLMDELADDLAGLLDAMGISQPVTYCGLSMGGYVAWSFVRRHRERLARLILCDTLAAGDSPEKVEGRLTSAQRAEREGTMPIVEAMMPLMLAERTLNHCPDLTESLREIMVKTRPETVAAALRGMAARPDSRELLPTVNCPSLLICGEEDAISPPEAMEIMAEAMPDARLICIPEAGHMAPMERPVIVNGAIRVFMHETARA